MASYQKFQVQIMARWEDLSFLHQFFRFNALTQHHLWGPHVLRKITWTSHPYSRDRLPLAVVRSRVTLYQAPWVRGDTWLRTWGPLPPILMPVTTGSLHVTGRGEHPEFYGFDPISLEGFFYRSLLYSPCDWVTKWPGILGTAHLISCEAIKNQQWRLWA